MCIKALLELHKSRDGAYLANIKQILYGNSMTRPNNNNNSNKKPCLKLEFRKNIYL